MEAFVEVALLASLDVAVFVGLSPFPPLSRLSSPGGQLLRTTLASRRMYDGFISSREKSCLEILRSKRILRWGADDRFMGCLR